MTMAEVRINHLRTEAKNPRTLHLDLMDPLEILTIMNEEDEQVVWAVRQVLPQVAQCVAKVTQALKNGGRLIYAGAGTSGRLGILDAVECVPTFSTREEVQGIIAGGEKAFVRAVEGAEDSMTLAREDLEKIDLNPQDVVIAITASGRTPYAIGALDYARSLGASAIGISCNSHAELSSHADLALEVEVGPEVLTGSTRLKAGTAQKMILNMISTASMVGVGKVYGNLMVDMKPTNLKLLERAKGIVMESTGCTRQEAEDTLKKAGNSIKTAIVMILGQVELEEAQRRLQEHGGFVRKCLSQ